MLNMKIEELSIHKQNKIMLLSLFGDITAREVDTDKMHENMDTSALIESIDDKNLSFVVYNDFIKTIKQTCYDFNTVKEHNLNMIEDMLRNIPYPSTDQLLSGVLMGYIYEYVYTDYLNAFINHVNILKTVVIKRHSESQEIVSESAGQVVLQIKDSINRFNMDR